MEAGRTGRANVELHGSHKRWDHPQTRLLLEVTKYKAMTIHPSKNGNEKGSGRNFLKGGRGTAFQINRRVAWKFGPGMEYYHRPIFLSGSKRSMGAKLPLSPATTSIVRQVVKDLLQLEPNKPCMASDLANALGQSEECKSSFAAGMTDHADPSVGLAKRCWTYWRNVSVYDLAPADLEGLTLKVKRRLYWTELFAEIEKRSKRTDRVIATWEDAKLALEESLIFNNSIKVGTAVTDVNGCIEPLFSSHSEWHDCLLLPLRGEEKEAVKKVFSGVLNDEIEKGLGLDLAKGLQTLRPEQWLHDGIINYYYLLLAKRDAEFLKKDSSRKPSFFFESYFMTKLLNEGHSNPLVCGAYLYDKNVKNWSRKKVPGGDIFSLDKIVIPTNVNARHWICAVVFMTQKKIQIFDSLGYEGHRYLQAIFHYLQDEHEDRKGQPLPEASMWQLVPTQNDTPRQANGMELHQSRSM